MRINPHGAIGSRLTTLAAHLLRALLRLAGATYRHAIIGGGDHLAVLLAAPRPVVISYWHNRSFLAARFLIENLHQRGQEITVLTSQSRDGELVARMAKLWRFRTVRGSATRGGRQALRALYGAIVRHRSSPVMMPDGPTGPLYRFKIGAAVLAQMSTAPVLPMGFAAKKYWRLGSWDRLIVPRPFTTIAIKIGAPVTVPKGLSSEDLEAKRQELEDVINRLTRDCEHHLGVSDD
jgi:lysophospholipid acyltransferase (LPLAT)-like uncharacterized protein